MVLNAGIVAQSVDGYINKTTEQSNHLSQNADEENSIESVRKYYEAILETDSTNYNALTNLGVIYQSAEGGENLEKSLLYFEKAAKFHPQKSRAYHNLGILNSIMRNLDEAVINLNKAAELDSRSPNSIRQLGIIYLQNEKLNEAIESFNIALSRDNKDTESYLGKSLAYWVLKDYDKALAVITEMRSFGLRFNRMELLLADVYFKKKDYGKAMKYAKIDKQENFSKAEGHYLLGQIYISVGKLENAKCEFTEVSSIIKQNPDTSLKLSLNIFFESKVKRQLE